jgi:hypothetical protein
MNIEIPPSSQSVPGEEQKRNEDAYWAQHDPQVEKQYGGQWVVPHERKIVAHGTDLTSVLQEAARLTNRRPDELVVCAIPQANSWLASA